MKKSLKIVLSIIMIIISISFYFGGGLEKLAQNELDRIENQVAIDSEK
ncbi:hypothetical protein [Flavivirga sp. 57AJ16]|nr:hypothetical protein [Flavivirga sp. 57AJ16]MDD7887107.1 hypothetical protein [Flavivirga sp. 57AJ16]